MLVCDLEESWVLNYSMRMDSETCRSHFREMFRSFDGIAFGAVFVRMAFRELLIDTCVGLQRRPKSGVAIGKEMDDTKITSFFHDDYIRTWSELKVFGPRKNQPSKKPNRVTFGGLAVSKWLYETFAMANCGVALQDVRSYAQLLGLLETDELKGWFFGLVMSHEFIVDALRSLDRADFKTYGVGLRDLLACYGSAWQRHEEILQIVHHR